MSDIWMQCHGSANHHSLENEAWRIHAIEQDVLDELTDSATEKLILSNLLSDTLRLKKFLFKEPPLDYASRFGNCSELSIWYGSLQQNTALTEKAYYIFHFIHDGKLLYYKRSFEAINSYVSTENGIDLTQRPFSSYRKIISSPSDFKQSQVLGSAMRTDGIQAFYFYSARCKKDEINVGVFTPIVLKLIRAIYYDIWECKGTSNQIKFIKLSDPLKQQINFSIDQFLVKGILPSLANC